MTKTSHLRPDAMELTSIAELLDSTVAHLMPGASAPRHNPAITNCASLEASARWSLRAEHKLALIRLVQEGHILARSPFSKAPILPAHLMPGGLPPSDFERYALTVADTQRFFTYLVITPPDEAPSEAPSEALDWRTIAQAEAKKYIEAQREQDLYPRQIHVADKVATILRAQGVFGAGGKPLTGETIKRHALKGISSGTNGRGK